MSITLIVAVLGAAGLGAAGGWLLRKQAGGKSTKLLGQRLESKLVQAKKKVAGLREQAEADARELRLKTEKEMNTQRAQLIELEKGISGRESSLDAKIAKIEQQEGEFKSKEEEAKKRAQLLAARLLDEEKKLAEISGLTKEAAEVRALELAEERTKKSIVQRLYRLEKEGKKQLDDVARNILSSVIQRYAASHVAETAATHVHVEDESLIGRVIGREGRNIQHLERLTGCELIVDETPNSIMISGFSPVRRQVAKTALEKLLSDGRIHPGRIEEVVEEAKNKINDDIREAGEAVVYDLGIIDFPEQLVQLIGRLKYRTSYRQNILKHSWEAAHIATMLAEELGADVTVAKKATLLHDIGKAVDHEVEGSHVEIGEKIMKKFGIDEQIIKAAAAHHEDPPYETPEAYIVQVADAISAARPGARRDNAENYVKRMEDLENIAANHDGVEKAYAIYAGREIRVFVKPENIDDLGAIKLAQDIAKQIEQELTYPGEVKVNVIRETRAGAVAR
jgi:ribonucrease Y